MTNLYASTIFLISICICAAVATTASAQSTIAGEPESGTSYSVGFVAGSNKKYLSANGDGTLKTAAYALDKEQFTPKKSGARRWTLSTHSGKYVSFVSFKNRFETRVHAHDWEKFEFHPTQNTNTYLMYSPHFDVYISYVGETVRGVTSKDQATPFLFIKTPTSGAKERAPPSASLPKKEKDSPIIPCFVLTVIAALGIHKLFITKAAKRVGRGTGENIATKENIAKGYSNSSTKCFTIESEKLYSLRFPNGQHFSANPVGSFSAAAPHACQWEQFQLQKVGSKRWSLRSYHNKFVCFDQGKKIFETRDVVGDWEKFEFHTAQAPGTFLMYNACQDIYLSFSEGNVREVYEQQQATPIEFHPSSFSIQAPKPTTGSNNNDETPAGVYFARGYIPPTTLFDEALKLDVNAERTGTK